MFILTKYTLITLSKFLYISIYSDTICTYTLEIQMAIIFPTLENIKRLKKQPTDGEWFLINYLIENLPKEIELYFQPFINGDIPDIVLIEKEVGVTIIEVKDWNLGAYRIDSENNWYVQKHTTSIKSPFMQVNTYKDNLFELHINGLLEFKLRQEDKKQSIYGKIKTFVYFHNTSKKELDTFSDKSIELLKEQDNKNNNNFQNKSIQYNQYEKNRISIKTKLDKIKEGFNFLAVTRDNLWKITLPKRDMLNLLSPSIYEEFLRYLQPPLHVREMGKAISYTQEQQEVIESKNAFEKVKGVAGSGKTAVLAKRAVNAHKRHGGRILILTYNITLLNYIHDKISDIKEKFSWDQFYIINYHEFFKQNANYLGIDIKLPEWLKEKIKYLSKEEANILVSEYFDTNFYSNKDIFKEYGYGLRKYKSIFIDEIQDYTPAWLYIIKNYMLEENGEMVLFGDEKQNLYHHQEDSTQVTQITNGFEKCHYLKQATRQLGNGDRILDLSKKFQKAYFSGKYELDDYENQINQLKLEEGIFKVAYYNKSFTSLLPEYNQDIEKMLEIILKEVKNNNIHNNDYCILSSRIDVLREVDYVLRNRYKLKTMTTFESKERYISIGSTKNNPIGTIHRHKKLHFWSNSGTIKLATVHSYKGFESQTVFLILNDRDDPEQVYAGFTRSKSNLMVFMEEHSDYKEFFRSTLNKYELVKKDDDLLKKLYDCISNQVILNIEYKQYSSIKMINNIKPYKILFMNSNFYLACEVDNQYKFTLYRISNILDIEIDFDNTFDINIEINDFITHIQTPFARYRENYRDHLVRVVVEIDKLKARFFESKSFLPSQKVEKTLENGNLMVSFTVTQELEVEELIKKWLPHLKVIEPLTLDEKIKSDIRKYLY